MLKDMQLPGHKMLLMKQDDKNLIEVTDVGTFYSLRQATHHAIWQSIIVSHQISNKNELRLSKESMQRLEFEMSVPGTKWNLIDLPDPLLYSTKKRKIWKESVLIFFLIAILSSLVFLFFIKKQYQSFLFRSEQELKEFINSAPVIMWMTKVPGQKMMYNNARGKFSGSVGQKLAARQHYHQLVHIDDQKNYLTIFTNSLQDHKAFEHEYRLLDKNRHYRWVKETAIPRFNYLNHYQGHTGVCIDITEQKQNEESYLNTLAKFK